MTPLGACVKLVAEPPKVLATASGVVIKGNPRKLFVDGCAAGCGDWYMVADAGNRKPCCHDG
jgi:hypothetical protein